jgi:hypothetical protein
VKNQVLLILCNRRRRQPLHSLRHLSPRSKQESVYSALRIIPPHCVKQSAIRGKDWTLYARKIVASTVLETTVQKQPAESATETRKPAKPASETSEIVPCVHSKLVNENQQKPALGPALLKTAVTFAKSDTQRFKVNLILDNGSQRSFITATCASQLELKPEGTEMIKLAPFGSDSKEIRTVQNTTVTLESIRGSNMPMRMLVVEKISVPIKTRRDQSILSMPHIQGLELAENPDTDYMEIDILIGADYYWTVVGDKVIRPKTTGPVAVATEFGYVLSGPAPAKRENPASTPALITILKCLANHDIEDKIAKSFWDLETIGIKDPATPCETTPSFMDNYRETSLNRDENGQYIASFPWLQNHPALPTNYEITYARTRSMVRKLGPELLSKYNDIIQNQLDRNFISKVPDDDRTSGHYLPHHAVKKESSSSTPIRIVYDASCKQSATKPSLNECLDPGPTLLNDLNAILLRFRTHKIGLSSDIEKAFLHVRLDEKDREMTKFLWLMDPNDPESSFETYHFNVVLFGTVSSPFMLHAAVYTHLETSTLPIAADLKRNIYVDNVLTGCSDSSAALAYYENANAVMQDARFKLRAWSSNDKLIRERAASDNIKEAKTDVHVLGMKWNTESDRLSYVRKTAPTSILPTKREVVRYTSSIFDPLGYLTPTSIQAKSFIQQLWKSGINWDEPISEDLSDTWSAIVQELDQMQNITLSRQFLQDVDPSNCELHVFSDASPIAYGSAVYLKSGKTASLVMAKTRVKPLKDTTIPRMELLAAVTATRLAKHVCDTLSGLFSITKQTMWIDSQIVIHWIKSVKTLPVFVQNRVTEIRNFTGQVKYVPTKDNPADLLTRGISASELKESDLWWSGPSWLSNGNYPSCDLTDDAVLLQATSTENIAITEVNPPQPANHPTGTEACISAVVDIKRFSSYLKLLKVTALVEKFAHIWITRERVNLDELIQVQAEDISAAEKLWIKAAQTDCYRNELEILKHPTGPHAARSKTLINQLRLYLDQSGLIRLNGRLHNADIGMDTKFPYLMPRRHPLTDLVIQQAHVVTLHSGMQSTVTWIRQRFWIPRIREAVNSQIRRCVKCLKIVGKPYQKPESPPLPVHRIREAPPFSITGCDFTGALYVIPQGEGPDRKVYIALYTCAITRAVHLELVPDMTTRTFLNSFRRFCARRSTPSKMISDNAMTFISAATEITKLLNAPEVKAYMTNRRVDWTFNPKRAPWWGGFFERLIGMTKLAIMKTLGKARITFDELLTLVTIIESILNDRPLTYIGDSEPLTPAHLLHGRQITGLPFELTDINELSDPDFGNQAELLGKRAKYLSTLIQNFWHRWSSEYIPALRERHIRAKNGKLENIVIIEHLEYGNDGLARSARIRTKAGFTNRPIARLYPLETAAAALSDNIAQSDSNELVHTNQNNKDQTLNNQRPQRRATAKAREQIKHWADILQNNDQDD